MNPISFFVSRIQRLLTLRIQPKANLAEVFFSLVDPRSPYLFGAFICGFFCLSTWGNFFYALIVDGWIADWHVWARVGLSTGLLAACAVLLYLIDIWRRQSALEGILNISGEWEQPRDAKHYPGVITLFNAINPNTTETAVMFHTKPDVPSERRLRCCWCIMDQEKDTEQQFEVFKRELIETRVEFLPVYVSDTKNVHAMFAAVDRIYREEIRKQGLYTLDVITDITAGLKPMSVGMAFACLMMYDRRVEYIQCDYEKATKKPIIETAKVIEMDMNFYLKQGR